LNSRLIAISGGYFFAFFRLLPLSRLLIINFALSACSLNKERLSGMAEIRRDCQTVNSRSWKVSGIKNPPITGAVLPVERKCFMEIITKDGYPCCLINEKKNHIKIKTFPYMNSIGKFPLRKILGKGKEKTCAVS